MKHISFFLNNLGEMGGIERITTSLANELVNNGYRVSIISLFFFEKPYFEIDKSINTYHVLNENINKDLIFDGNIFSKLKTYFTISSRLESIIKKNKINLLVASGVQLNPFWILLKFFRNKIKIVSWEHTNATIKRKWWLISRRISKRYSDAIVVLTQQDKKLYIEESPSKTPIFVINNFINIYPAESSELNNKNVLAIGRFSPEKGFDILIEVWRKVKNDIRSKDWILNLVGEGPEKEKIESLISEKDLDISIVLAESTPNIAKFYLDTSVCLMTSRLEGFGLVLMEAQCFGIPTVSFDCPTGPREIIKDEEDGFLITIRDTTRYANRTEKEINAMSERILQLMENENLRKEMGITAKQNSLRFKKENIVNQWVELIENLNN